MSLNYKIKIVYDFEESQYVIFVYGIRDIEGYGQTEEEALKDFEEQFQRKLK